MKYLIFILVFIVSISCKKEVNSSGYNLIGADPAMVGAVDTFTIRTSSRNLDTSATNSPAYLLLGSINDPVFGKTEASFCSQLRLITTSPDFGEISSLKIDSVVLSMRYLDNYGLNKPLKFDVFRISENLDINKVYYSNSKINCYSENLSINSNFKTPLAPGKYFINQFKDTIYDQISIELDTMLGRELINKSKESPSTYASIENFNSWFKGLKIVAKNETQAYLDGAIYYISSAPRLTIYYKQGGKNKQYYFELNQNAVRINLLDFNKSGYEVDKPLANSNFYTQSNSLRAYVELPYITSISTNSVVHSAKLELPYDNTNNFIYTPGNQVSVMIENSSDDKRLRMIGMGSIDTIKKLFTIDLREHIQSVVAKKRINSGLFISPREFSTTSTRIKFINNGEITPKLYLKVSSFKK